MTDSESYNPLGSIMWDNLETGNTLFDDSAIVYESKQGLVIVTGCSYSVVCNFVEHARKVCGEIRIADIIGGFHLLNPSRKQLMGTIYDLNNVNPMEQHTCHCTDLDSKIALSGSMPLKEVGSA